MSTKTVKLSNPFVPKSYNLQIKVDLSSWTYEARETVVLKRCAEVAEGGHMRLHAASSIAIESIEGATLVSRDEDTQTLLLELHEETLKAAEPTLHLHFKHTIQEELRGFYRVRFHHEGKEHRMASTHFEPTAARRFYVCHDEPAARADFTLAVELPVAERHYTVLSNGPLVRKTESGDAVRYEFQTVPLCPPYLTACVVGELEYVETVVNAIPVRVYTALGKIGRAAYPLKLTAFALDFFEKFFKAKFPLPKLDVVAVPDFPIGGMENWGCIACIDSILVDPATSSAAALRRASELLCHEVSHNWFGNLVAISWWEGLWLKEGFASWCGNYASHAFEPSWNCLDAAAAMVADAMDTDMYAHSHPVEVPIADPAHITEIFDSISYDKGMGLVFMLQAFLGEEKWSAAAAHYINKFQFRDTKTVQLWEALEESSGLPIAEAMRSFTTQMGYPLVEVAQPDTAKVLLRQRPCTVDWAAPPTAQRWCIPVKLTGLGVTDHVDVMLRTSEEMEVAVPAALAGASCISANPLRTGFYRCRYDDALFDAWLRHYPELPAADRRAILSDTVACIQMGYDDVSRLAALSAVVRHGENTRSVLEEFATSVRKFTSCFADATLRKELIASQLHFFIEKGEEALRKNPSNSKDLDETFLISTALEHITANLDPEEARARPLFRWAQDQAAAYFAGRPYASGPLRASMAAFVVLDDTKNTGGKGCTPVGGVLGGRRRRRALPCASARHVHEPRRGVRAEHRAPLHAQR
ncbi:metallo-peptidase, Clan MA(E), Family M1 [Strigomonas culicis]|uniref:Aminopeptidase n=1 Tax=Strigomonas culicis TaxID=28005 RepID=S9V943_9TRYP|nr:metallo-peptidase, Clan MA(E), Family M1 [Strigomonas culicis]|eukprot:EPY19480.1 metallo-peptidase, Clan MA(E), Family M1 [Strigomonas culicis]